MNFAQTRKSQGLLLGPWGSAYCPLWEGAAVHLRLTESIKGHLGLEPKNIFFRGKHKHCGSVASDAQGFFSGGKKPLRERCLGRTEGFSEKKSCGSVVSGAQRFLASADKTSVVSADKTFVVSADKTSVVSADKTSVVSADETSMVS